MSRLLLVEISTLVGRTRIGVDQARGKLLYCIRCARHRNDPDLWLAGRLESLICCLEIRFGARTDSHGSFLSGQIVEGGQFDVAVGLYED